MYLESSWWIDQQSMKLDRTKFIKSTQLFFTLFLQGDSFVTGRTSLEFFVFTSAVRTHKSSPGNTFVTRPNNQRHLGMVLSTTRTRSLTAKSLFFSSHFCVAVRLAHILESTETRNSLLETAHASIVCVNIALPWRRHQGVP